jgi:hypothetical protein
VTAGLPGTTEQVGGCCLVDGKDLDEAIEVAMSKLAQRRS